MVMEDVTTISVRTPTKAKLILQKLHKRESFDDVLIRILSSTSGTIGFTTEG